MSERVGPFSSFILGPGSQLGKGLRTKEFKTYLDHTLCPNWPKISSSEVALLASLEYIITRFRNAAISAEIDNKP